MNFGSSIAFLGFTRIFLGFQVDEIKKVAKTVNWMMFILLVIQFFPLTDENFTYISILIGTGMKLDFSLSKPCLSCICMYNLQDSC